VEGDLSPALRIGLLYENKGGGPDISVILLRETSFTNFVNKSFVDSKETHFKKSSCDFFL
jgi:hypothetical protein